MSMKRQINIMFNYTCTMRKSERPDTFQHHITIRDRIAFHNTTFNLETFRNAHFKDGFMRINTNVFNGKG